MKTTWTLLTATLVLWTSTLAAQNASDAKQPAVPAPTVAKAATQADVATALKLRAEMHRAMAALLDARAAEQPDAAVIAKLTTQVQTLRGQIVAQTPGSGPGRGYGLGPGRGYGRGAGWQRGGGRGMGMGAGMGPWFVDANGDGVCDYYQPPTSR
jgi:hypothetical protein